jgi:hypothetical protein
VKWKPPHASGVRCSRLKWFSTGRQIQIIVEGKFNMDFALAPVSHSHNNPELDMPLILNIIASGLCLGRHNLFSQRPKPASRF